MNFHRDFLDLGRIIGLVVGLLASGAMHVDAGIVPLKLSKFRYDTGLETDAVAVPFNETHVERFGYIEYKPNGTLILRSTMENGTNMQNLLLFKAVMNAIKLAAPFAVLGHDPAGEVAKISIKMYSEGVEHKFPPFFEGILQRIQNYFSIYKYTDTSRPGNSPLPLPSLTSTTATATAMAMTTATATATATPSSSVPPTMNAIEPPSGVNDEVDDLTHVDAHINDEYTEFITIDEMDSANSNDGFITVGED